MSLSVEGVSWNKTKFLSSEMASVPTAEGNLLSQSFGIASATFSIGSVSLHLRELQGSVDDYSIHIEVRIASTDGTPTDTVLASAQKNASDITWTGWHTFSLTMAEAVVPDSHKLAIIFWQDGGDEDNYIAWTYSTGTTVGATATYSNNDGSTWYIHNDIVRMIRVSKAYDPFAYLCDEGVLRSSVAEEYIAEFDNFDDTVVDGGAEHSGNHDGTKTEALDDDVSSQSGTSSESSGSNSESSHGEGVVISNKKLLVSIVVDNSGSMGWNDRGKNKVVAVTEIVNQIKASYPGKVKFDIVAFGSVGIGTPTYGGGVSGYATIKVNPNNPTSACPNNDGTEAYLADSIVSCGFSNLKNSHTYVLQSVTNGNITLFDGAGIIDPFLGIRTTDNAQSIGPIASPVILSVQSLGTGSEVEGADGLPATIAEVPVSGATQVRRPIVGGRQYAISGLTNSVNPGTTRILVETPETFEVGDVLDFVDIEHLSTGHVVTAIGAAYVDVTPAPLTTFGSYDSARGGFVQQTAAMGGTYIDTSSQIELLVKDNEVDGPVTFFAQTNKGGRFEWSFLPMEEWFQQFIVYIDKPEDLVTYLTDEYGRALPPNTRVTYYVSKPKFTELKEKLIVEVTPDLIQQGDDQIFISDVSEIKIGDEVTLVSNDGNKFTGYLVAEIDDINLYIRILPPVMQGSFVLVGLEFKTPLVPDKEGGPLDIVFTAIDSSSNAAGRLGTNRLPSDLEQLPVPAGDLNDYNQDRLRWMSGSFDVAAVPSTSPNIAFASLRFMPITDDKLNSLSEEDRMASVLNQQTLSDEELAELDAQEDIYQQIVTESPDLVADVEESGSVSPDGTLPDTIGEDYIFSPSEAQLGSVTQFSSFSQEMEFISLQHESLSFQSSGPNGIGESEDALSELGGVEVGILARVYETVYPAILVKNARGSVTSRLILPPYPVYFASPIQMFCVPESSKTVTFGPFCCTDDQGGEVVYNLTLPGVFAASDIPIRLDYMVYNRGKAVSGATIRVKIYDATRNSQQISNEPWNYVPVLEDELGSMYPNCKAKCGPISPITGRSQRFNRRSKNSDGSYAWAIDKPAFNTVLGRKNTVPMLEATYLPGYAKGGFGISTTQGLASFTIPAIDVVAKLVIVSEVVCVDNPAFSCVRTDSVWIKNPVLLVLQIPRGGSLALKYLLSGLDVLPVEAAVVMTCFGQPVPDNILVTLNGSSHLKHQDNWADDVTVSIKAPTYTPSPPGLGGFWMGFGSSMPNSDSNAPPTLLVDAPEPSYWPETPVRPSVGKTIGGIASGYMVSPHGLVTMHAEETWEGFEQRGDQEIFSASASYKPPNARGEFFVSSTVPVEWWSTDELVPNDFFVHVTTWKNGLQYFDGIPGAYTDGWTTVTFVADIPASKNRGFIGSDDPDMWSYAVGKFYDFDKPAVEVTFGNSPSTASTIPGRTTQFYATRPTDPETGNLLGEEDENDGMAYGWAASRFSWCIQLPPPPDKECKDPLGCCWPPCDKIKISSRMRILNKLGMLFRGCTSEEEKACWYITEKGTKVCKDPAIIWKNPLDVNFYVNGETGSTYDFVRDGVTKTEIWAYVTFSGEPLPVVARRHDVRDATGVPMPMPQVVVSDIYYLDQTWNETGILVSSIKVRDGTLSVEDVSPMVSLCRTTATNGHYHSCVVDDITGEGVTTGTFLEDTVTVAIDHIHSITNFEVESSDVSGAHSHTLLSIAVITVNPISNQTWNICIEATLSYDASKSPVERTSTFSMCTSLQWFDYWDIELQMSPVVVEEDVMTENQGFNLGAKLEHIQNGSSVPILDSEGIRVTFDVKAYQPKVKDGQNVPTFDMSGEGKNESTSRAVIEATATLATGGKVFARKATTSLQSSLQWSSSVVGLTDEPTDDDIYIAQAIERTHKVMGGSQIYDAVVMAADRLNTWQTDNTDWKSSDKVVFLLTDGCENLSQRTINQVASRLSLLSTNERKPFLASMVFGSPSQYDLALMQKIRSSTGGALVRIPIGYDPDFMPDRVAELFSLGMNMFNSGTYTGTIDVGADAGAFESVVIDVYVPDGAVVTISFRFSNDGDTWTEWSSAYSITGITVIPTGLVQARYIQYDIRMVGNGQFESPIFRGIQTTYLKPSTDVFFMRPIPLDVTSDDYVGEVVLNHAGTTPDGSDVTYGLSHHDTPEKSDYAGVTHPWFKANQREVVMTRFNEPTLTNNNKTFTAINGSWPSGAAVDVYLIKSGTTEGILLPSKSYVLNSETGKISLPTSVTNGDRIMVDIKPDSVLRLAIRVFNASRNPVEIGQITAMYNKTKRVRRTSEGTIVRHPIGDEIDDSSSSSSSLSSLSS